jgi:hypothetical protein
MPAQEPVTLRAAVRPGRLDAVRSALESDGARGALPLSRLPEVHFARMFILEAATLQSGRHVPASLVYMADVDGSADRHLRSLADLGDGLDALFGACEGYPDEPDRDGRLAWMRAHDVRPAAYYVHSIGRTVGQIKDEARLFSTLQDILDSGEVVTSGADPARLRDQLRAAVRRRPGFSWIAKPPPGPGLVTELRDTVRLYVTLAALLLAAPVLALVGAGWLVLIRLAELTDRQEEGVPDQAHVDRVRQFEDFGAQNPFTAVGEVKPGALRRTTMRIALAGLGFACRHAFGREDLAGVTSIHFARWVPIDEGERLIFASSYDGSLESYMDDFISRLAWGINLVFSNGAGFPRTRWLVFGGARDEIAYKHYLRRHQVPTVVFYAAYPDFSAPNVDRFTAVRRGIARRDDASAASLARLL